MCQRPPLCLNFQPLAVTFCAMLASVMLVDWMELQSHKESHSFGDDNAFFSLSLQASRDA